MRGRGTHGLSPALPFPPPAVNCKSVAADKTDEKNIFQCPVYKTEVRGPMFVFLAQLKTKSPAARWVMAGAAIILDIAT